MSEINLQRLKDQFPPDRVSWRVGPTLADKSKGIPLAYIDARDVMDRLDEVCGPGKWRDIYPYIGTTTVCCIEIKVDGEWVGKSDGSGTTDVEAEKGQLSDAFKRAAVKWGIGRYLYDIKAGWVKITQKGKSYVIDEYEYKNLEKLLSSYKEHKTFSPPSKPLIIEHATEKLLSERLAAFEEHLDKMRSSAAVTNLVAANNKLLFEASEHLPEMYEKLGVKINQIQEAFLLMNKEAAE